MIDKDNFHVLNFVIKEPLTGSMDGMRYQLEQVGVEGDRRLEVTIWPEPNCYMRTPEEQKQRAEFELSAGGVEDAAGWLNEQYMIQKALWDSVK